MCFQTLLCILKYSDNMIGSLLFWKPQSGLKKSGFCFCFCFLSQFQIWALALFFSVKKHTSPTPQHHTHHSVVRFTEKTFCLLSPPRMWWNRCVCACIKNGSGGYNGCYSSVAKLYPTHLTPWTIACQVLLSSAISQSLLKFVSIELMTLSNHLIFCHSLLLFTSIFPSIKVFSSELALRIRWPKYWNFSGGQSIGASASATVLPMNIQSWFS